MSNNAKILCYLLKSLKVNKKADDIFDLMEVHPPASGIICMIDVLNELGIENASVQFEFNDFHKISELPTPLIVQLQNENDRYVAVESIRNDSIKYYDADIGFVTEDLNVFNQKWSGIALIVFPKPYEKSNELLLKNFENGIIPVIILALLVIFYYLSNILLTGNGFLVLALFVVKMFGLGVSLLLLQNEINSENSIVNQLCSSKTVNCNQVLNSSDSKFLGLFSWSDLGIIYFSGSAFALIFTQHNSTFEMLNALFVLNLPTILFSFYSVWYQYFRAKAWCQFCLITISLFWVEFVLLWNIPKAIPILNLLKVILIFFLSFGIPVTLMLLFKATILKLQEFKSIKKELNRIKFDKTSIDNFLTIQNEKKEHTDIALRIFGTQDAINNLTIITSPTCPPCAAVHKKIEEYFNGCYDNFSLDIIFSIDTQFQKQTETCKVASKIIQIFKSQGQENALKAMHSWYNKTEKSYEKWQKLFPVADIEVDDILDSQYKWCVENSVHYTPTVLLNLKELHHFYDIDDLKYLL